MYDLRTNDAVEWVKKQCVALHSNSQNINRALFAPLSSLFRSARIIGLGEATHGTQEFFALKFLLVKYLVEHQGFNIFAIEANKTATERINKYVKDGEGDPAELLRGIYRIWNSTELLEIIEWMHNRNAKGNHTVVEFKGFDIQTSITDDIQSQTMMRDRLMAENVRSIFDNGVSNSKLILWAHNFHVARQAETMGSHLSEMFAADYCPIGFCFHEGQYNARENDVVSSFEAQPSTLGGCEWLFHCTGVSEFIIDLRSNALHPVLKNLFALPSPLHDIGAVKQENDFGEVTIAAAYDGLVFVDRTTPSHLLPQE